MAHERQPVPPRPTSNAIEDEASVARVSEDGAVEREERCFHVEAQRGAGVAPASTSARLAHIGEGFRADRLIRNLTAWKTDRSGQIVHVRLDQRSQRPT